MRISSARDLGLFVRDRRQNLDMTQAELAAAANVSRRWLTSLESGKPTAEIGLVLRTLDALGLVLDAELERRESGARDLDELLRGLDGTSND
jgi:HTH-type transcriptional regulator/antitoxin HipB